MEWNNLPNVRTTLEDCEVTCTGHYSLCSLLVVPSADLVKVVCFLFNQTIVQTNPTDTIIFNFHIVTYLLGWQRGLVVSDLCLIYG